MVNVIAFVGKDGTLGKYAEPVSKTARNKKLPAILCGKHDALPRSEGGTTWAQVDAHIKHLPLKHTNELGLGMLNLEMQPS